MKSLGGYGALIITTIMINASNNKNLREMAGHADACGSSVALKNWELSNGIDSVEKIYRYDANEQQAILAVKPWEKDPHYFKEVKISALALLKMVMHARRGGNLEIMGVIQGKVDAHTIIIMDSFALPVEGTETRVNAQSQAYEYMSIYSENCEPVGRLDKVVHLLLSLYFYNFQKEPFV